MILTVDGVEFDTEARTATEGDLVLELAEGWQLPNVPESDDYDESFTGGWHQEDGA